MPTVVHTFIHMDSNQDSSQPRKQRVTIFLDSVVIEHFKEKAGDRGYQTLINEALRNSIETEDLLTLVRATIRDEFKRQRSLKPAT
jgi:BrnA antitoxin of type II toxin-antitoxin system